MIGKEILNYTIVSKIGGGGMGVVYLAEHKFIKQQKVAIKVIHKNMVNTASKERLQQEAEKLASLNHPNIVKFLNYHIDEEGNVFLIMEYAEGSTIEQTINTKTGLIVESKILPIFEPILDAVEYAHKHNVIHRDIKPSNIIITTEGVPKILDFGISTIYDDSNTEKQESFIVGTPSYMSPEQVKGKGIDFRSDIYSLGVLLHQMLTGNAPYDTTTMSEVEIQAKVITDPLPRMKTFYRYISEKMQAIVDKATAKNPEDRYQNCAEFRKNLLKLLRPRKISRTALVCLSVIGAVIIGGSYLAYDYNRVKIRYFKDYVEQWGIPQGIGKVSASAKSHMTRLYRFEYRHYKLQRVSHINSLGNIIDDDESERQERPIDMYLYYSDNNLLSRVKTYDRSGKLVFVKAYNDRLTSAVFQYDDEFGTEKSLSGQTIGYANSGKANENRGKISRWLITYDSNGYVASIYYAGYQNIKVGDAHNIYGRSYIRDDKGRVKEEHYLGYDGQPKATKWGLGIKKFYFDEKDNWVKAEYYTVDMLPAMDDPEGIFVYALEYDNWGNVIQSKNLDANGNLMLMKKSGVAGLVETLNQKGLVTEVHWQGVDGQNSFSIVGGYASKRLEYDENGYVSKETYYDVDGNICSNKEGIASIAVRNDTHGNHLEILYYGTDGELTIGNDISAAGYMAEYDTVGNPIKVMFYGLDKNPTLIKSGVAGYIREYNSMNLCTKEKYFDAELQPSFDENGVAVLVMDYDKRGNRIKTSFMDAEEKELVLSKEKIAGWESTYDDNGNEIERMFFNTSGQPCLCNDEYSKKVNTYDENGNLIKYRYYNLQGKLAISDGIAGYDYSYDQRGNILENRPVGTDETLKSGKLISKFAYDEFDNQIEFSLYDRNEFPATNSMNYHKATYQYNSRNQLTETRYYNVSGTLVAYNDENYAIERNEYDERGYRIHIAYLGIDENPVNCSQNWSSSSYEYDSYGNVIRQLFFDTNGDPTIPSVMVPEGICKYDKWGNRIYLAAKDGKGNFIINPSTGWCIKRNEYDIRGNELSESYFDVNDEPMNSRNNYHKVVRTYTSDNDEETVSYFGPSEEPVNNNAGYHKETNEYDSEGRLIRFYYSDKNGKPVNCSGGYQKVEVEWDGTTPLSKKSYSAGGKEVSSESWNGIEWVADKSTILRQIANKLNNVCPMDMGEEYGNLVISSVRTSGATCYIYFKVPYSKYEMNFTKQAEYKNYASFTIEAIKQLLSSEYSISGISFSGIVNDSKNRELSKFTL